METLPKRSTLGASLAWLAGWILCGALAYVGLHGILERRFPIGSFQANVAVERWMEQWAEEHTQLERDGRRKEREAAVRRALEFEKAAGGPAAAAFRDPELTIREALRRGAVACAPTNTFIQVEVDRFTEFTVTMTAEEAWTTNKMTEIARTFVPLSKEYLDALRFATRTNVVAELDRGDLDFIEDWSRAPAERVAMLLPREMPARVALDSKAMERVREENELGELMRENPKLGGQVAEAERAFSERAQEAALQTGAAADLARHAAFVSEARSFKDFDARSKNLREAAVELGKARQFWGDLAKAWEKALAEKGVEESTRARFASRLTEGFVVEAKKVTSVFRALDKQLESTRYLFQVLERNPEQWRFASGRAFEFTDAELERTFRRALEHVRNDLDQTERAFREWQER